MRQSDVPVVDAHDFSLSLFKFLSLLERGVECSSLDEMALMMHRSSC